MPPQAPPSPFASSLVGTPPPRDWKAFATEEALRQGVDPELVHRVIDRESKWNPRAISGKGAEGLMQLMPETARSLGVTDPFDGEQNIRAGVKYLKDQLAAHKGDRRLALAAYNSGPANVARFRGIPPFAETQAYVQALDQPPSVELAADDVELVDDVELAEGFDPDVAKAASKATRLTPGYSAPVDFLRGLPAAAGSLVSTISKGVGPQAALAGSVLGGVGAGVGEAATIGAEHLAYRTGFSGVPPPPLDAAVDRVSSAVLTGAGGELVGRGVGKALAPFASKIDATGREVQRLFPDALPNQVVDSRLLDSAVAVSEAGVLSGGQIAARKAALANQARQEAFGIVHKYGGPITREQAGTAVQQALEGNTAAFKQEAGKLYADVDRLAKGATVNLQGLKAFAAQELEKRAGIPGEVSGNRGLKMLSQVVKAGEDPAEDAAAKQAQQLMAQSLGVPYKEFATAPEYAALRAKAGISESPMALDMSFQQAQTYRSDLLSFIRRAKNEKDDVARGVATQLLKRLDEAMDVAGQASPTLATAYQKANKFYREGKQKYESELLRGLTDLYPEQVAETLVKPNATTPIREARAAIGPQGWKAVQARVADDLLSKATDGDDLSGKKLLQELKTLSQPTLREVFPEGDAGQALWVLGRTLERAQRAAPKSAKVGVWIAQSGATVSLLSGSVPAAGGAILLTPAILGKILTSKTGAKWLTTGLAAPKGSKLAAQAARKVLEQYLLTEGGGRPVGEPPPAPMPSHRVGQPPPTP